MKRKLLSMLMIFVILLCAGCSSSSKNQPNAYTMSGVERVNVWDYQGAIQYFDQAIQSQPNDTDAYILRGEMKSRLWDDQGALKDYSDAIVINPKEPMAYMTYKKR